MLSGVFWCFSSVFLVFLPAFFCFSGIFWCLLAFFCCESTQNTTQRASVVYRLKSRQLHNVFCIPGRIPARLKGPWPPSRGDENVRERTRRAACRAARTQTELPDFIGAPRAAGVNSGTVHLVCRSSRRVYDPVTSRSFILRFICANGGQSGVPLAPPPSPLAQGVFLFIFCSAHHWLAACHQDQSRTLTHHHSSC